MDKGTTGAAGLEAPDPAMEAVRRFAGGESLDDLAGTLGLDRDTVASVVLGAIARLIARLAASRPPTAASSHSPVTTSRKDLLATGSGPPAGVVSGVGVGDVVATPAAARFPQAPPIPPELREWALEQFTDEDYLAGFRDIRENGGLELKDFLHELDQAAAPDEQRPDE